MRKRSPLTPAAFILLLVLCLFPVQEANASAADKSIVVFMPNTDWPPYMISDSSYDGRGVILDVLGAIAANMDYSLSVRRLPDRRGWKMLKDGTVDAHAKAREWVKNPDDFLWTDPFMLSQDALLCLKSQRCPDLSADDLLGQRIATINSFYYPVLEPLFKGGQAKRMNVNSPYAMLELLELHRCDLAVVNRQETQWLFRTHPKLHGEHFRFSQKDVGSAQYRFVFTNDPKWKPVIKEINKQLALMRKNGTLSAIINKYR